jgi:hypothetical protein
VNFSFLSGHSNTLIKALLLFGRKTGVLNNGVIIQNTAFTDISMCFFDNEVMTAFQISLFKKVLEENKNLGVYSLLEF